MPIRVILVLLAAAALAPADITVRGILTNVPGGNPHSCVAESTMLKVAGVETWYATPGWSAAPNEVDSFDFPPCSVYPESAVVTATFDDSVFVVLEIPHPSPALPYQFPQPYRRITVQLATVNGLEETRALEASAGLSIAPSVVHDAAVIRAACPGRLEVVDVAGRVVRSFAAPLELVWRRDDAEGRRLDAGVYVCRLTAGSVTAARKVVLSY
ncbi:hypothetical protein FJY71_07785 [candidate division WOR-3 bacterium]|nr:hypothetical protein [candidate division WOR-3 bacterium]